MSLPISMRLRGSNPMIEVLASNLSINLAESGAPADDAAFTLRLGPESNAPAFFHVQKRGGSNVAAGSNLFAGWADGCAVCASDLAYSDGYSIVAGEPSISLRTWSSSNCEKARVDAHGFHCDVLDAGRYVNLVDSYTRADLNAPPTANALYEAYLALSNQLVLSTTSNLGATLSNAQPLVNAYTSTSVLNAPTANALRAAYSSLSNAVGANAASLSNQLPELVRSAVLGLGASACNVVVAAAVGAALAEAAPRFQLSNDVALVSVPDMQPRMFLASNGPTIFAAGGDGLATAAASEAPAGGLPRSFAWSVNDMQQDVMCLTDTGQLWVREAVSVGADPAVAPTISSVGSNVGVNMPAGVAPVATLHVHGSINADDGMYMLSDKSVKTDIAPITDALDKLHKIRGCSYLRTDTSNLCRHIGVIAQDVHAVVPEAVHVGADGRMSVAYGNLVALLIEAIRELSERCDRLASASRDHGRSQCG